MSFPMFHFQQIFLGICLKKIAICFGHVPSIKICQLQGFQPEARCHSMSSTSGQSSWQPSPGKKLFRGTCCSSRSSRCGFFLTPNNNGCNMFMGDQGTAGTDSLAAAKIQRNPNQKVSLWSLQAEPEPKQLNFQSPFFLNLHAGA